jgi:hypothetical protein
MGNRPFQINPRWSWFEFLNELFTHYRGGGIQSTGYRLNAMRNWLTMVGRTRAMEAIQTLELEAETDNEKEIATSLWMSESSYKTLKRFVLNLPSDEPDTLQPPQSVKAFISYKWESGEHVAWVRKFASELRARGIEALLDQWAVRYGESFTDYMQRHISEADVILFVITPGSVSAAEAPTGKGGALKFEVQMMNARRMSEGTRIIGIYRSGERPPHYLRDHRYVDFRDDEEFDAAIDSLVEDLLGRSGPPPVMQE